MSKTESPTESPATTAGPDTALCKACDMPALPLGAFCAAHQPVPVQPSHKTGWLERIELVSVVCLIFIVFGYPTAKQRVANPSAADPARSDASPGPAPPDQLSDSVGTAPARGGSQQAAAPAAEVHSLVARSVAAVGPPATCGNGIVEPGEECDGHTLAGATCSSLGFSGDCGAGDTCIRPGLACLRGCRFDYAGCTAESEAAVQRFVSNGNGTASDRLTGLMWEQKCTERDCTERHNVFARLAWRDGAAQWVDALNQERFAGHNDWRLPSLEELRTLLVVTPPCTQEPCPGSVWPRNQTAAAGYWSSTTFSVDTHRAWAVSFGDGDVYTAEKGDVLHVRAVRRGS